MKINFLDGFGLLSFTNGGDYSGHFKEGKRSGYGVRTYQNKDIYEGESTAHLKQFLIVTIHHEMFHTQPAMQILLCVTQYSHHTEQY